MTSQLLMNALQTVGKFFLDLDPHVTEHLARHFATHIFTASNLAISAATQARAGLAADFSAILDSLNNIRIHFPQG